MCDCGSETEITGHFFLHYPLFAINRQKLFNNLLKTGPSLRNLKYNLLLDISLYGPEKYKDTVNKDILLHTISFIKNSALKTPLFNR